MDAETLSVLIVDDDRNLSTSISLNLELTGFSCSVVESTSAALKVLDKVLDFVK